MTTFMKNLTLRLQAERNIAQTTIQQYMSLLIRLNNGKNFTSLAFLEDADRVTLFCSTPERGSGISTTVLAQRLFTVSSIIAMYPRCNAYKFAYAQLYERANIAKSSAIDGALPVGEKTEKEKTNWITTEEIVTVRNKLKDLATTQSLYLDYLVLCLYTMIHPRRNRDFQEMKIGVPTDETVNWYNPDNKTFVFQAYKTAKTYGAIVVNIPEELDHVIQGYLTMVGPQEWLLPQTKSPKFVVLTLNRIFKTHLDKPNVGSSMLRKVAISSDKGYQAFSEVKDMAEAMGHSVDVALKHYLKK